MLVKPTAEKWPTIYSSLLMKATSPARSKSNPIRKTLKSNFSFLLSFQKRRWAPTMRSLRWAPGELRDFLRIYLVLSVFLVSLKKRGPYIYLGFLNMHVINLKRMAEVHLSRLSSKNMLTSTDLSQFVKCCHPIKWDPFLQPLIKTTLVIIPCFLAKPTEK